jgi:hypothetical protein
LLLGVSAVAVTFELAAAGAVSVDVDTLTLVGAGGLHPNVKAMTIAAAVA